MQSRCLRAERATRIIRHGEKAALCEFREHEAVGLYRVYSVGLHVLLAEDRSPEHRVVAYECKVHETFWILLSVPRVDVER